MAENNKKAKSISAEQFVLADLSGSTLLDLREPDQVLIYPFERAVNIPHSIYPEGIEDIPKDKPVYVICNTGIWSEEVADTLCELGYDAIDVKGGSRACVEAVGGIDPVRIDARGLKCPGPIVKVADTIRVLPVGQKVIAEATEDAFSSDIEVWCERTGNRLLEKTVKDGVICAVIEKALPAASINGSCGNDKNFVVFSGDLDKTIAAFIMANGAAAMGRNVTMFFTFWGLNILRRPEKVNVAKSFIEKMFGLMMPRGTMKLGLSRMNMGGIGARMIRYIMKEKNIRSLEELINDARAHGVRIVACQMSMDIMGIHKEELIDGVELGGVSTFLGAGEKSDMSLFI